MKHILTTSDFSKQFLLKIFDESERFRNNENPLTMNGRIVATLFYEPSTRTRLSFECAMLRLGGQVISTEAAAQFSSHAKGESLEDTIRVVGGYADAIVLRHHEKGAALRAANVSPVSIINAGDGDGEHPTQAILDLYTIWRHHGRLDNLKVVLVGDLRYGRAVHSLLKLLALGKNIEVRLVSPPAYALPAGWHVDLSVRGLTIKTLHDLSEALRDPVDVVYMTRLQRERLTEEQKKQEQKTSLIRLDSKHMDMLSSSACVLHPLPRLEELPPSLDGDSRVLCFEQARNGLYIRMALIDWLFKKS
jgi:aspartate carbamoyltransferase catalytic subunit